MSQQRPVFPFPGFGEEGLLTFSGPRMAAKSWLPLPQPYFGEWEEDKGRAGTTWSKALGSWNSQQAEHSVPIPIL